MESCIKEGKPLFQNNAINEFIDKNIQISKTLEIGDFRKNYFNEDLFIISQNVELKDSNDLVYESHEKYYDIHYIVDNTEIINVIEKENLKVQAFESNEKYDYFLYKTDLFDKEIKLESNKFIICKFNDIHKVGIKFEDKKESVNKIVIKIKKEFFEKEFINE